MSDTPFISIGIVTWNSAKDLPTCLAAIGLQQDISIELVVVDNASQDISLQIVKDNFPGAVIIANPDNRGFCGGHNQAIQNSTGAYYMPLNPDVILRPDYLAKALSAMNSSDSIGMVAGRLLLGRPGDVPQRIDSTGLFLDRRRWQFLRAHDTVDEGQYSQVEEVFGVDGSAPLYRRAMLEDIQIDGEYFDEAFFAHKEDVDLCWRARLLGWRCMYTPHAVAYHQRHFRPGKRKGLAVEIRVDAIKNRYLLLLKNEMPETWRRDWLSILWYDLKILGYLLLFERSSLKALSKVQKHWKRTKRWRNIIQARKRASQVEMLAWFH